jgi:DNA-binding NtrC family response regulator
MILIVEDDPLSRRALQAIFAAKGYPCKAVNSAEDALEVLQGSDQSGIALIDIDLPGMNGLQLLQQLQAHYPNLACTLMSANEHDLTPRPDQARVPFFAKPLNLTQLLIFLSNSSASNC